MIAANSASSSSYDVRISALDRRVDRADGAAHLDAGAVGQPGVEHRDVGPQRRDPVRRLLGRAGLADHLDVAVALEQGAQALAHDLVVVEQVDADLVVGSSAMGCSIRHRRRADRDLGPVPRHRPAAGALPPRVQLERRGENQ